MQGTKLSERQSQVLKGKPKSKKQKGTPKIIKLSGSEAKSIVKPGVPEPVG